MQTNNSCSSAFLEFILGSNTVCPELFLSLTVLMLEEVSAFFLLFCRGTFFVQACSAFWERSAHNCNYVQLQYTPQVENAN